MIKSDLQIQAEELLEMHNCGRILVLPTAWDAGSARLMEVAGFRAVGTSSAGIAFTHGLPDGQWISRDAMLLAIARIVESVNVPVTADVEAGYGDVALVAHAVLAAGAVGLNVEDMDGENLDLLVPLKQQMGRIRAMRDAADEHGVHLVINARTDMILKRQGPAETRLARTIDRLKGFADAGADCVFVPGVTDEVTIAALVEASPLPLNVLAQQGTPPVARLQELGVARVSMGSAPARAALCVARRVSEELLGKGTYETMTDAAISFDEMNRIFEQD